MPSTDTIVLDYDDQAEKTTKDFYRPLTLAEIDGWPANLRERFRASIVCAWELGFQAGSLED